jgi:Haem-binding domain
MKKFLKIFAWILLIAFIGLQFFRPAKNKQEGVSPNHISKLAPIPTYVSEILEKACYDCHSNNSSYPWYFNIQPVGIWMDDHIKEGKRGLNFSEYTNRSLRFQYHKLEEIVEQVEEGEMPLDSYTWTHRDAVLTKDERTKLIDWANYLMVLMKTKYPIDSLERKKPS